MELPLRDTLGRTVLVAWGLLLAAAVFAVFELALGHGNRYPRFSTARSDGLGCRVLFEALASMEGAQVGCETLPLPTRSNTSAATLLIIGAPVQWLRTPQPELLAALRTAARAGSRIILAFDTSSDRGFKWTTVSNAPLGKRIESARSPNMTPTPSNEWLATAWSVRAYRYDPPAATEFGRLGSGALAFELRDPAWTELHHDFGYVVVAERPWEGGTLVVAGAPWFLTNDGLRQPKCRHLAARVLGPGPRYVFHESHLGLQPTPTLRDRLKSLRLHGLILVLAILGALAVWRQATPLWPVVRPDDVRTAVAPLAAAPTDWSDLLRRHLTPRELLMAAIEEWQRSGHPTPAALEQARTLAQEIPILDAWRRIAEMDHRRRRAT